MKKESLEEVMKKYKLSEEEHMQIGERIKEIYLFNRHPVDNPTAIVDIAPPASGKTGLNGYGSNQFIDNNVVVVNSDEIKPFHPAIEEIAKLYPDYYTKITDQESNTWTSDLFDTALREGYNVIFEGTGRNARILDTIKEKMQRHQVIVRGMAVDELNCLLSILERYREEVDKKGIGRLVVLDHFYETYNEMPNVIDLIEKSNVVKAVEVYKRGELPTTPIKIYDGRDRENGRFPNAKYAIFGGRQEDKRKAMENVEERIKNTKSLGDGKGWSEGELKILAKIQELVELSKKKQNEITR